MKPLKLKMNAFGAFLKETEIDFTNLTKDGLFLISGPTGSGKTTIFDAICFALYGETSGDQRSSTMFRSDYAKDSDKTYVNFTFLKEGKIYEIERIPSFKKDANKTSTPQKASLILPNKEVVTKTNQVNEKVKEIIGLDIDQFRQIVMLAQGEFMKLIYAQSKDREAIFRQIFGTKKLEQLTKDLKEEYSNIKEALNTNKNNITQYLLTINDLLSTSYPVEFSKTTLKETTSNLSITLNDLEESLKTLDKEVKHLYNTNISLSKEIEVQKQIKENTEKKLKAELELNTLLKDDNKYKALEKELTLLKECLPLKELKDQVGIAFSLYENKLNDVNKLKEDYIIVKAEYDFVIDNAFMLSIDKEILNNLFKQIESLKTNITLLEEISSLEERLLKNKTKEKVLDKDIKIKEEEIKKLENEIKQIDSLISNKSKINEEISNIKTLRGEENKLVLTLGKDFNDVTTLKLEQENLDKYLKDYENKKQAYNKKEREVDLKEQAYYNSIIGSIASELKYNMPCPVCGSLTHPAPASISLEVVSKDDLNRLKQELKDLLDEANNAHQKYSRFAEGIKAKFEALAKNYSAKNIELLIEEIDNLITIHNTKFLDLDNKANQKAQEYEELSKKIDGLNKEKSHLDTLKMDFDKLKEEKNILVGQINNTLLDIEKKKKQVSFDSDLDELKNTLKTFEEDASYRDENIKEAEKFNLETKTKYDALVKSLDEENIKLITFLNNLNTLKEQYDDLLKSSMLAGFKEEELNSLFNKLNKIDSLSTSLTTYNLKTKDLKTQIESLNLELKDKELKDTEKMCIKLDESNKQYNELLTKFNHQNSIVNMLKSNLTNILKEENTFNKLYDDYTLITNVYNTISGSNNARLSFERFVMLHHFENILNYANVRLLKITNGRFRLVRKEERNQGTSQSGLDLEILDYETGKVRDVKTLSGGETFKAALSLSLGLSDAIEARLGGVEVDTLFIDEGFGTLDQDSLNSAISILTELKGCNKSVGIISHVQELSNIINAKIIVSKDDIGSKIKLIF